MRRRICSSIVIICMMFVYTVSAYGSEMSKQYRVEETDTFSQIKIQGDEGKTKADLDLKVIEKTGTQVLETTAIISSAKDNGKFSFEYNTPSGCTLLGEEEYNLDNMNTATTNNIETDEIVYVVDNNKEVVATIGDIEAVDAKGKSVEVRIRIKENQIFYDIDSAETVTYPITVSASAYPVKYKYEYINTTNCRADINRLIAAQQKVDECQNSTLTEILKLTNTIFGLFNLASAVFSIAISETISSGEKYLEACENMYTRMITDYYQNKMNCALITYSYRGTYQGKNKGYVYTALHPTWEADVAQV